MNSFNFLFELNTAQVPFQIIKLNNSFFIFVGDKSFTFNNLIVCLNGEVH